MGQECNHSENRVRATDISATPEPSVGDMKAIKTQAQIRFARGEDAMTLAPNTVWWLVVGALDWREVEEGNEDFYRHVQALETFARLWATTQCLYTEAEEMVTDKRDVEALRAAYQAIDLVERAECVRCKKTTLVRQSALVGFYCQECAPALMQSISAD